MIITLALTINFILCVTSVTSVVPDSATLWTVACQAPLSMGFSRQEYWSGLWGPPPGRIFLTQASIRSFLHCRRILQCRATGEAHFTLHIWANFKRVGSGTKFYLMQNVENCKNYEYFTYT